MRLNYKNRKGFTLMELLIVISLIGILVFVIWSSLSSGRLRAKNAAMVLTMSTLDSGIDLDKYPGSLEDLCLDFETGGDLDNIRDYIEEMEGIWNCDSTESDYRVFVKLNQEVVVAQRDWGIPVYAESENHPFGNFYCLNSGNQKNFTHWSGNSLAYPSCYDGDYISIPEDPEPDPEPTPDPEPESDPEPPAENGGGTCGGSKENVCHFGKTLCISKNAVKAHVKHGDTEGAC